MRSMLNALWNYRGFVLGSIKREFQTKYQNSILGAAWNVINPLSMICVYTIVFSNVMHARLPGIEGSFAYSIYLCSGILTWGLFAEIVGRSQNVFLENANLIKKLNFPRICLPVIVVFNAGLNFGIIFTLFSIFLIFTGNFPGIAIVAVLPVLLIQILFSVGLGITLGILNVFFRDVGQLFSIILQFWFWFTPIVYPATILPKEIAELLRFNPMAALILAYQRIFVNAQMPVWTSLITTLIIGILFCFMGFHLFHKRIGEMVDEL